MLISAQKITEFTIKNKKKQSYGYDMVHYAANNWAM